MASGSVKIAPSILSADFNRLGDEVRAMERAGADLIHVDVMDGRFVPNITIGPVVVEHLKRATSLPLDVHLMIVEPERYVEDFIRAGAATVMVHVEACVHLHRTLEQVRALNAKCGVVLNPSTPASHVFPVLEVVDQVLVMSVNPGFGGQKFIPAAVEKVRELRARLNALGRPQVDIEVDGGINDVTGAQVVAAGATMLVAGHYIFKSSDPAAAIKALRGP